MWKAILLLVISVSVIQSEYVWTGTEWKWQEPGNSVPASPGNTGSSGSQWGTSLDSGLDEGSGGGDNFDDEDDYDYDDEDYTYDDDYEVPSKKKNKEEF